MKFISLFLSLFFALLITIPCNDEVAANSFSLEISMDIKGDLSHETNSDNCSVFCTCSCCGIVMVLDQNIAQIKEINQLDCYSKITDIPLGIRSKIPFGIWQPPKLS